MVVLGMELADDCDWVCIEGSEIEREVFGGGIVPSLWNESNWF